MRLFIAPLILLGLPLAEIAGFVIVGRVIGLWATLALVILTGIAGVLLLRAQGLHILRQISSEGREGRLPGKTVVDGAMIVVAGILLLLPGFVTDILGLLLFIPFVRHLIWNAIGQRVVVVRSPTGGRAGGYTSRPSGNGSQGPVVDLDEDDFTRDPNPSSPWSKQTRDDS